MYCKLLLTFQSTTFQTSITWIAKFTSTTIPQNANMNIYIFPNLNMIQKSTCFNSMMSYKFSAQPIYLINSEMIIIWPQYYKKLLFNIFHVHEIIRFSNTCNKKIFAIFVVMITIFINRYESPHVRNQWYGYAFDMMTQG